MQCDVEAAGGLELADALTARSDLVVSMLPYLFHPRAAKLALKHGKHFLTTSYVSPAMRELEVRDFSSYNNRSYCKMEKNMMISLPFFCY